MTQQEAIDQARMMNDKLQSEVEIRKNDKEVSDEVKAETIKQAHLQSAGMIIENELKKLNVKLTQEQIYTAVQNQVLNTKYYGMAVGKYDLDWEQLDFKKEQWAEQMDQNELGRINDVFKTVLGGLLRGK